MADALSVTSSLITLAGFAFQASKSLYQTIESFKSVKRTIRELRNDLESLLQVLLDLQEVASQNEVEFAALKLPLLRCGKICNEFEETLNKCITHSNGERRSFRDWAKLQYRGGDITDLRAALAGYKATIGIALGSATFRQAAVTTGVLDEYRRMVEETKSDLRDHLENIDERLQLLHQRAAAHERDDCDLRDAKEEKESTEQCLRICAQVSEFIERSQAQLSRVRHGDERLPPSLEQRLTIPRNAEVATKAMLSHFRSRLSENSTTLKTRLAELDERLRVSADRISEDTDGINISLDHMKEERDSILKCLDMCADASSLAEGARTNIFEDVSSADHSHQLVVSTIGDLISAKRIVTGARSVQWLGQMSDDTLQKLSGDHRQHVEEGEPEKQRTQDNFRERYGNGYNLHVRKSEGLGPHRKSDC